MQFFLSYLSSFLFVFKLIFFFTWRLCVNLNVKTNTFNCYCLENRKLGRPFFFNYSGCWSWCCKYKSWLSPIFSHMLVCMHQLDVPFFPCVFFQLLETHTCNLVCLWTNWRIVFFTVFLLTLVFWVFVTVWIVRRGEAVTGSSTFFSITDLQVCHFTGYSLTLLRIVKWVY